MPHMFLSKTLCNADGTVKLVGSRILNSDGLGIELRLDDINEKGL